MDALSVMTGALAIGTFALAWYARRTWEEQRTQTRRAHRPVVVAADTESTMHPGTAAPAREPVVRDGKLQVPLRNVGMGPALNIRGLVDAGNSASTFGTGRTLHPIGGLGAGVYGIAAFSPDSDADNLNPQVELAARLAYEDVAGDTYWTDLHYNGSTKGWRSFVWGPTNREEPSNLPTKRRVQDVLPDSSWKVHAKS